MCETRKRERWEVGRKYVTRKKVGNHNVRGRKGRGKKWGRERCEEQERRLARPTGGNWRGKGNTVCRENRPGEPRSTETERTADALS